MTHTIKIIEEGAVAGAVTPEHKELLALTASDMLSMMPRLVRAIKQHARSVGSDHGPMKDLGESQVIVLYTLLVGRRLTSELARRFNVTNPTMTRIVDALVDKGYVERQTDPNDRRRLYLQLTEAGLEIAKQAHEAGREALVEYISPLSEEQLRDILRAFSHLQSLLPTVVQEGDRCPLPALEAVREKAHRR